MNNISVLHDLNPRFVGGIRERLGASGPEDTSKDEEINLMTGRELAATWAGWSLGDESWAAQLFDIADAIKT